MRDKPTQYKTKDMKTITEIFNEPFGLDNDGFKRNTQTTHILSKDADIAYFDKKEGFTREVVSENTGRTLYLPDDNTLVYVSYTKEECFCHICIDKDDRLNLARKGRQIINQTVPYGVVLAVRESVQTNPLGEYESFASRIYRIMEGDSIDETSEKTEEFKDFSYLGFGFEFRRGEGFFKTDSDNGLVGTFFFESEEERDSEFKLCCDFYSQYKKACESDSSPHDVIWDSVFTNGLTYDLV